MKNNDFTYVRFMRGFFKEYWTFFKKFFPWGMGVMSVPIMLVAGLMQMKILFTIYFIAYVCCGFALVRRYALQMVVEAEQKHNLQRCQGQGGKEPKQGEN